MALDPSEAMRLQLATVGITLDEPRRYVASPPASATYVVDRQAVRAELEKHELAPEQLNWLVASCPSVQAARAFTPTKKL